MEAAAAAVTTIDKDIQLLTVCPFRPYACTVVSLTPFALHHHHLAAAAITTLLLLLLLPLLLLLLLLPGAGPMLAVAFQAHAGQAATKNWKRSIKVQVDGALKVNWWLPAC
jgi:hypothetical protein